MNLLKNKKIVGLSVILNVFVLGILISFGIPSSLAQTPPILLPPEFSSELLAEFPDDEFVIGGQLSIGPGGGWGVDVYVLTALRVPAGTAPEIAKVWRVNRSTGAASEVTTFPSRFDPDPAKSALAFYTSGRIPPNAVITGTLAFDSQSIFGSVDSNGNPGLYITSADSGKIYQVAPDGSIAVTHDLRGGLGLPFFHDPVGIAFGPHSGFGPGMYVSITSEAPPNTWRLVRYTSINPVNFSVFLTNTEGNGTLAFDSTQTLAFGGDLYGRGSSKSTINRISPSGTTTTFSNVISTSSNSGIAFSLGGPFGEALYVGSGKLNGEVATIFKILPDGTATIFASGAAGSGMTFEGPNSLLASTGSTIIRIKSGLPPCISPPSGLVSWWSLDETSGLVASDLVGNNHGVHINGPTPIPGFVDGALSFDGVNDKVEIADDPSLNFGNGDFSVAFWAKPSEFRDFHRFIEKYDASAGPSGWIIYADISGNVRANVGGSNGVAFDSIGLLGTYEVDNWHFYTLVKTTNQLRGYQDGVLTGTINFNVGNTDVAKNVTIGQCGGNCSVANTHLKGLMDEVQIFNRALSDEEILAEFNAGSAGKCKSPLMGVRVIDTVSTVGIDLDSTSFSIPPASIVEEANQTIIEWQFAGFDIGQIENLSFDVILKNPIPGEDRLVNHKLEVLYTDVNGNPVRTELGPQFVHVLESAFNTVVSTNKGEYTANEDVLIDLSITNLGETSRIVDAVVDIEDSQGNLVQTVSTLSNLTFISGETKSFLGLIYNTSITFAGDFQVHVRLIENGSEVGEALSGFSIISVSQATSTIVADKIAYSSNEAVTLTSTVTSQSLNSSLTNLEATVTVIDPNNISIFTETKGLADLLPEGKLVFKSFTDTGTNPAGLYTATLEVNSNGQPLVSSQTSFEILSSLDQSQALSGSVSLNPRIIFETEDTTISYNIQNIGNEIDLPVIDIEVLVVDPDTELPVRTITDSTSLNGREIFANSILFDSTGLPPKPYLVVLQGATAGVTQTLDSAGLQINPIPNTAPLADAGLDQSALVGQSALLDGTGSSDPDGDPLTFNWHFESVPTGSLITDSSFSNSTTPNPSFVPDQEGVYVVSLVVNDGIDDSPVDTVSVFVNPAPDVDIHPETINLKSNGGSKSVTGVLTSPVLSAFEFFTASDGVTVAAVFSLENRYIDANGNEVIFTIPADDYPGDDLIETVDADGNGSIDLYQLTLKFDRDLIIQGFTDSNGDLLIVDPTPLTSTVIGSGIIVGSDINTAIAPGKKK